MKNMFIKNDNLKQTKINDRYFIRFRRNKRKKKLYGIKIKGLKVD